MKLEMHFTDPKHGKYTIDATGALMFFLVLLTLPVVVLISGVGLGLFIIIIIGVVGFVHFGICFFGTLLPFIKADIAENKAKEQEEKLED